MEKRYTRRYNPFMISDFVSQEAWLEDCAKKGLKLVKWGAFPKFEYTAPFQARYRIEFHEKDAMDDERIAVYAAQGWEFVAKIDGGSCIFCTRDPNAPELHTDPALQAYALRGTLTQLFYNVLITAAMPAFEITMAIMFAIGSRKPMLELLETGLVLLGLFPLILLISSWLTLRQIVRFAHIWFLLRRGKRKAKARSYRSSLVSSLLAFAIVLTLIGGALFIRRIDTGRQLHNLSDWQEPLPFLQLHEIEGDDELKYDTHLTNGIDFCNFMQVRTHFLAPQMIRADQDAVRDPTERYAHSVRTEYYELRHEKLAIRAIKELVDVREHYTTNPVITVRNIPGADEAFFGGSVHSTQYLFLRVGCKVISINYDGDQDLLSLADQYIQMLS